jgi:hypothetical protein
LSPDLEPGFTRVGFGNIKFKLNDRIMKNGDDDKKYKKALKKATARKLKKPGKRIIVSVKGRPKAVSRKRVHSRISRPKS